MIPSLPRWLALGTVVLLALGLRTCGLDRRPMHADEANQAVKAGLLLEGAGYAFDPGDHHGPTLYYATLPVAWWRGEHMPAALTETTVRLVPAAFGVVAVVVLGLFPRSRESGNAGPGRWVWILAAAWLAVSPPAVYYARDYIQETLLLAFTLLTAAAAARWCATRSVAWAVVTGVGAGLMLATKETAPLLLAAGVLATVVAQRWTRTVVTRGHEAAVADGPARGPALLCAIGAALLVAGLFYSSFGANPAGIRDALLAPGRGLHRATAPTGHEKPWWYYLQLLTYVRSGGFVWEQFVFLALAVVGAVAGVVSRCAWLRGAAVYAVVLLVVLSAVPYKTPWNVIHAVPPLCLLAAGGVAAIARLRTGRIVAGMAVFLATAMLLAHTVRAAFVRPADGRNPWAYVHSSPDVRKYRALVVAALAAAPGEPVRVISGEYWPLPWYLRGLPRIGYWSTPPADCDGALIITSVAQADVVRARLRGRYAESFLGLRPGVVCVIFKPEGTP